MARMARSLDPAGVASMEHIDRRSFLDGARQLAVGGLAAGAAVALGRPTCVSAQAVATEAHPPSARVLDRLKTPFTFPISLDVAPGGQGLAGGRGGAGGGGGRRGNGGPP